MMKGKCRTILMKSKGWGWRIWLFLIATLTIPSPLQALAPKTNCHVEYINDRLTINADKVAFGRVLEAIREKTGVEFVLSQGISEVPISIQLGPLPVVESLERILSHSNHAFILGADQKLIKVVILDYSKLDSSPRAREVAETPGVARVISPSSTEAKDIKSATEEGRFVTSSLEIMDIGQPVGRDTMSRDSLEAMVTKPSSLEGMVVPSSLEAMVIKPASVEMIIIPPTGE